MGKVRGIHMPHFKHTADFMPVIMPVPSEVVLPMSMHSGAPAKPVVAVGDSVKVGQLIGEPGGTVSSPVHASVSGRVKAVSGHDPYTGSKTPCVTIVSDGKQELCETLAPPVVTNLQEFLAAVRDSGVVGLGGAGYPTANKLTLREGVKIDYVLINGAECEPYITADTRAMVDDTDYIFEGAKLLKQFMQPGQVIICIEDNKPEAIKKLTGLCAGQEGISVRPLPAEYPQGERKVLVYNVTGRIVPEGGRLPDVGCVVINCTTVAVMTRYIKTGMPMVSRTITVDGPSVNNPQNLIVPIGAKVSDVLDFCGGLKENAGKILLGGPMMGKTIPNLDFPVVKVTSAVLAFPDVPPPEPTNCIKCGKCITKCPMRLMPPRIEEAFELKRVDLLKKYKVNMCAECGTCAYICPAKRPLAQVMSLSKQFLWERRNG